MGTAGSSSLSNTAGGATLAELTDFYRTDISSKLDTVRRSELGQYMTPAPIARFMASLFESFGNKIRVLDPGAGVGALTAALVERVCKSKTDIAEITAYEIDPSLHEYLSSTLAEAKAQCQSARITLSSRLCDEDFILSHPSGQQDMFTLTSEQEDEGFTHVIMNPPYRKIHTTSDHRRALRQAGIETSNLYTGFMHLAAHRLRPGGEMVAIVPRSFCNGPYFKPFRKQFLSIMTLRHIHVFDTRDSAFQDDSVLQENIVIHAVKGASPTRIRITASQDGQFDYAPDGVVCITEDMTHHTVDYKCVVDHDDPNYFIRIATNRLEQSIVDRLAQFNATLPSIGMEVSTGPVVDFRLKDDLRANPEAGAAPLLYATHFQDGTLEWPKVTKKPNAIRITDNSRKWLWRNEGHYVVTRRFTAKEENKRIVASVYFAELDSELIGFENHLNVFHANQHGMPHDLAAGLALYLNSSLVDRFFRQFSGHTQVNATDLRSLKYPDRSVLERIGKRANGAKLTQEEIDDIIHGELSNMTNESDPLQAQQMIDDALEVLTELGLPRAQQNERSALTLLALLDLKPGESWRDASQPLIGITPIMEYAKSHYGREYAPNTRETFRRHTMHQLVTAGIALYNPDDPERAINSPKTCYQISNEAHRAIRTFGTKQWRRNLNAYLK